MLEQARRAHANTISVHVRDGDCSVRFTTDRKAVVKSKYGFNNVDMRRCINHLLSQHKEDPADGYYRFTHEFDNGLSGLCVVTKAGDTSILMVTLDRLKVKKYKPKKIIGAYIPQDAKAVFHTKIHSTS